MVKIIAKRKPGRPKTSEGLAARQAIIDAAREQFSTKGFDGASLRAIAEQAGVTPALVHHYFESKQALFGVAMTMNFDADTLIDEWIAGGREELGERMTRTMLELFADPHTAAPLMSLSFAALTSEQAALMGREFYDSAMFARLLPVMDGADKALRIKIVVGYLLGVGIMRYVTRSTVISEVSNEELLALVVPTIQGYIDGTQPSGQSGDAATPSD